MKQLLKKIVSKFSGQKPAELTAEEIQPGMKVWTIVEVTDLKGVPYKAKKYTVLDKYPYQHIRGDALMFKLENPERGVYYLPEACIGKVFPSKKALIESL